MKINASLTREDYVNAMIILHNIIEDCDFDSEEYKALRLAFNLVDERLNKECP